MTVASGDALVKSEAIDAELIDIETLMADRSSDYWRGSTAPRIQQRYRDLLNERSRGLGRVERWMEDGARETRLTEIRKLRRTDPDAFAKNQAELEAEELRLLTRTGFHRGEG